jgi:ribose transport system substrate-binding protein
VNSFFRLARSRRGALCSAALAAVAVAAAAVAGTASGSKSKPRIAYLSYAVANSYDAPMLAAAKAVAKARGAKVTVFDAANDPKKQFAQFQTAATSHQYDGIIIQPIFGTALFPVVKTAVKKGIKVVNMDQVLGPNFNTVKPQVPGLSGNVIFIPSEIGTKQGKLVVDACTKNNLDPCNVGYLFSVKASSLDAAIRKGIDAQIAGHNIKIVAEGETFYQPAVALKAVQTMLQARSDINLIVGADQGATAAEQALSGKKVVLVGYGGGAVGLKAVASGRWYGTVVQRPATEGRVAMGCVIKAVKTGKGCGAVQIQLTTVTQANASKFKAEWPG